LPWVGTNGTTSSSSPNNLGKPLKFLRRKLKILELHQNKFENPQILKQYPQHYFLACETSNVTRQKLKILKFQNMKTENFKIHMKKGTYPVSSLVKTSHKKFEDPQNDKKEIQNFGISKYKNKIPSKFLEENQMPCLPPCETSDEKIKDPQNAKKKIGKKYENEKRSKFT